MFAAFKAPRSDANCTYLRYPAEVPGMSIRVHAVDLVGVVRSQPSVRGHVEVVERVWHVIGKQGTGGVQAGDAGLTQLRLKVELWVYGLRTVSTYHGAHRPLCVRDQVLPREAARVGAQTVSHAMDGQAAHAQSDLPKKQIHGLGYVPV